MGTVGRETHPQSVFLKNGFLTPSKAVRHTQLSGDVPESLLPQTPGDSSSRVAFASGVCKA